MLVAYHERCSQRGVCHIFGISRKTLAAWLKKAAALPPLRATLAPALPGDVLELDELWSFVRRCKNKMLGQALDLARPVPRPLAARPLAARPLAARPLAARPGGLHGRVAVHGFLVSLCGGAARGAAPGHRQGGRADLPYRALQ